MSCSNPTPPMPLIVGCPKVGAASVAAARTATVAPCLNEDADGSAGRIGSQQGKVSELTVIAPFSPGGAKRLRALLQLLRGSFDAGKVGSVHDMRFVFLDNDTRMLFATSYDGDWDAYIDDFATKIPDFLDIIDSAWEGWPGIRSPEAKVA